MLLLGGLLAWPVLRTVHASVTTEGRWVGVEHYRAALAAPGTVAVIGRTLLWALLVPTVVTLLGYLLAAASRRSQEGWLVRLILVVPTALPLVVTGMTFRLLYDPDPERGLATRLLTWATGRNPEQLPQLLGPDLVTVAVMSAFVWAWVGLAMLVFRAALDAVPTGLADAVRAFGGSRRDVLWDAQWRPLLLRTVAVVFALVAVGTSRTFDLILVMTPGSVRDEAAVLSLRIWQTSGATTTGEGAALGVVWLVAVTAGMLVVALFVRQAWPPPQQPTGGWWSGPPGRGLLPGRCSACRAVAQPRLHAGPGNVVTAAVLGVALLAAYPLAWLTGPAAQVTGLVLMAAVVVPVQVIAGPLNEVLGLALSSGTARGVALVHIALGVPFAVLVLRNAFADLPADQVRGARIGGRHWWGTLRRLARHNRTALVAVAVLEFVQVWNDLVVGLLFSGPDAAPLGLFLAAQTRGFVAGSGRSPLAAYSPRSCRCWFSCSRAGRSSPVWSPGVCGDRAATTAGRPAVTPVQRAAGRRWGGRCRDQCGPRQHHRQPGLRVVVDRPRLGEPGPGGARGGRVVSGGVAAAATRAPAGRCGGRGAVG